ncbi:UvrD-helicase domain-containing protein [Tessaracoccus lacteus]|uniref:RecBCD enzyme subunit RecB n=1 Tax=Tessaracoccus lacteus TaxID=3041766 RepID=A0ABY8PUM4_9ACTN|nr:UvrD-helicase domain-containing protein [Tessaracoccus sp. T21]WGT46143.1 UvrD-helicase domain-containing protein [Tessaracoccus sp. T21]
MAAPFDLLGPLPQRTTLLEASAGTGKTYAIAALAARYLAEEGHAPRDLLMITFGSQAAGELRDRVRGRISESLAYLDRLADGAVADPSDDPVSRHLAAVPGARDALAAALQQFGEITISTTHGFCQDMLQELGVLGDWDPSETVGPDDDVLAHQCASDTYLALWAGEQNPPIEPADALNRGVAAATSTLPLLPDQGPFHEYATRTRELYAQRRMSESLCTFNDIVARLRSALADPELGAQVRARLRERFPVVLVDEFQDTDPDQWDILREAFVGPDRRTVLIGDPKQSIYGFRGADLGSYLQARSHAQVCSLDVNYRSDAAVVDGVVDLFRGSHLGDETITVEPVRTHRTGSGLQVPGTARLWLRRCSVGELTSVTAAEAVGHDVVHQVRLLLSRATLTDGSALRPSDIAVLVRRGARAEQLRDALTAAGLPAVLTGSQSVWTRPAADSWRVLLEAMAEPSQANIRLAALSPLIGSEFGQLVTPGSSEPARVSTLVRELAHALEAGGIGHAFTELQTQTRLAERTLAEPDGERLLADLQQVAELLGASGATTAAQLLEVVSRGRGEDDLSDAIRLASDGDAIRVMTLHAAKGLEFPVVLLPETDGVRPITRRPFTVLEDATRSLWIGPRPATNDRITTLLRAQNLAEELRLLYVGFTRARHLVIAWHVDSGRRPDGDPMAHLLTQHGWRPDKQQRRPISSLTGVIVDSPLDPTPPAAAPGPAAAGTTTPLALGVWDRLIDATWRRTSYSGLTAGLHEAPAGVVTDEAENLDLSASVEARGDLAAASPMNGLPAGTGFGTLVHAVLERTDWSPFALEASTATQLAELGPAAGLTVDECGRLAEALVAVCRTPLTPVADVTLSDVPVARRLPELDFDLPLADGGAPATLRDLATLMATHLPDDDPLSAYPPRLASSEAADAVLNGFLTGSIDAVLRFDDGRFGVFDYKTNRLSPPGVDTTLGHYTPSAMAEAMMQAHYPLQAMLYCVALHRFLRATLPGYDPATHLGGVGYLFVRGMAGPTTPVVEGSVCGVFGWFPPAALTVAASNLLGGHHA